MVKIDKKTEFRTYELPKIEGYDFPKTGFYVLVNGEITKRYNSSFDGTKWRVTIPYLTTYDIVSFIGKSGGEIIHAKQVGIEKRQDDRDIGREMQKAGTL